MKRCSYCGAEYPDEINECPIDETPMPQPVAPQVDEPKQDRYEIPPLSKTEMGKDWVMILCPHTESEAHIVLSRLLVAGIRARLVRVKDYDHARELLNGA
jgi:hypothetical protein